MPEFKKDNITNIEEFEFMNNIIYHTNLSKLFSLYSIIYLC